MKTVLSIPDDLFAIISDINKSSDIRPSPAWTRVPAWVNGISCIALVASLACFTLNASRLTCLAILALCIPSMLWVVLGRVGDFVDSWRNRGFTADLKYRHHANNEWVERLLGFRRLHLENMADLLDMRVNGLTWRGQSCVALLAVLSMVYFFCKEAFPIWPSYLSLPVGPLGTILNAERVFFAILGASLYVGLVVGSFLAYVSLENLKRTAALCHRALAQKIELERPSKSGVKVSILGGKTPKRR